MSNNRKTYLIKTPDGQTLLAEFRWTISRARDSYGYNICSLWIDGRKVSSCNGGGYDMGGTCLGSWFNKAAKNLLLKLKEEFYGLTFHDPNYDPGKAVLPNGKTVEQAEAAGESLGLDRYQQIYAGSSKTPTSKHVEPFIDGTCGLSSVEWIMNACGYKLEYKG